MQDYKKNIALLLGLLGAICLLPSALHAPENKDKLMIEYLNEDQVYIFEKVGIDEANGRMVKHRDDTGGVRTISWDKDED